MSVRSVRSAGGITLVVVLFSVSFAASAGATVLIGSSAQDSGEPAVVAAGPEPSPSSTPTPTTPSPSASVVTPKPTPSPSPTKATKRQVKSATEKLCGSDPEALPVLSTASANRPWTTTFEALSSGSGITPGPVDGVFDASTAKGTRALQESLGLVESGRVGTSTWKALWNRDCEAPAPQPVQPSVPTYSGGGSSGSGSSSSGGGSSGGGTLDRVE